VQRFLIFAQLSILECDETHTVNCVEPPGADPEHASIRVFEYSMLYFACILQFVPDSLRQFKAEIFQALAHPTRIAILDLLREGEMTVGAFAERQGLEPANLSQHLTVLRAKQIVAPRKVGNQVFYSVRDPLIWKMLDLMLRYFQKQVGESMAMLEETEKAVDAPDLRRK